MRLPTRAKPNLEQHTHLEPVEQIMQATGQTEAVVSELLTKH